MPKIICSACLLCVLCQVSDWVIKCVCLMKGVSCAIKLCLTVNMYVTISSAYPVGYTAFGKVSDPFMYGFYHFCIVLI